MYLKVVLESQVDSSNRNSFWSVGRYSKALAHLLTYQCRESHTEMRRFVYRSMFSFLSVSNEISVRGCNMSNIIAWKKRNVL